MIKSNPQSESSWQLKPIMSISNLSVKKGRKQRTDTREWVVSTIWPWSACWRWTRRYCCASAASHSRHDGRNCNPTCTCAGAGNNRGQCDRDTASTGDTRDNRRVCDRGSARGRAYATEKRIATTCTADQVSVAVILVLAPVTWETVSIGCQERKPRGPGVSRYQCNVRPKRKLVEQVR